MNLGHKTTFHGTHLLIGAVLLSFASSMLLTEASMLDSRPSSQNIVPATRLLRNENQPDRELRQLLATRCTPGFTCGSRRLEAQPRVSRKAALRFALTMGIGVTR